MTHASGFAKLVQALAHQDQVGVVGDVARSRPEVNDVLAAGGDIAERVNVGHHVVPEAFLVFGSTLKVDVVEVRAKFRELCRGDPR